jgi:hypothetical protein
MQQKDRELVVVNMLWIYMDLLPLLNATVATCGQHPKNKKGNCCLTNILRWWKTHPITVSCAEAARSPEVRHNKVLLHAILI